MTSKALYPIKAKTLKGCFAVLSALCISIKTYMSHKVSPNAKGSKKPHPKGAKHTLLGDTSISVDRRRAVLAPRPKLRRLYLCRICTNY